MKSSTQLSIAVVCLVAVLVLETCALEAKTQRSKRDTDSFTAEEQMLYDMGSQIYDVLKTQIQHDFSRLILSRHERGIADDIQEKFKDFSERMQKVPDQLMGSMKKFLEERGISMESIQNIMKDLQNAIAKLIETVKQAFSASKQVEQKA